MSPAPKNLNIITILIKKSSKEKMETTHYIDVLANRKILQTEIEGSELVKKANEYLPEKIRIPVDSKQDSPYSCGHILAQSAVNRTLKELGITEIKTASPEEVMSLINGTYSFPTPLNCWADFALVLYKGGCAGANHQQATQLHRQLKSLHLIHNGEKEGYALPVVLANLQAFLDSGYPDGVRLDYLAGESSLLPAPVLKGATFKTKRQQTLEQLLLQGRAESGDLEVSTNTDYGLCPLTYDFKNLQADFERLDYQNKIPNPLDGVIFLSKR